MTNPVLLKIINTPNQSLISQLEKADTHKDYSVKAISLTEGDKKQGGGFSEAVYLYQNEKGEYRVLKVLAESQMHLYGGLKRKIDSFNQMYKSIYQGEFSDLATAKPFADSNNIIDMPYINGEEIKFDEDFNIVDEGNQKKLYEFFNENGFFITDYRIPGNVVQVSDEKGKSYFLIRDVDLLGRRNSHEVTPTLLKEELLTSYEKTHNLLAKEEHDKLKAIYEGKPIFDQPKELLPKGVDTDFLKLQQTLLATMKANEITGNAYERIAQAKDFPQLCDGACQHHTKPRWYNSEATKTMDLLRDELKKDDYKNLKSFYEFKSDKYLNVQLRSIGATSKNFIQNNFAQDKDKLGTARNFFRNLYYPDFDAQKRKDIKNDLLGHKHDIFHNNAYINELKFKLKDLKQIEQTQNMEEGTKYFSYPGK